MTFGTGKSKLSELSRIVGVLPLNHSTSPSPRAQKSVWSASTTSKMGDWTVAKSHQLLSL